MGTRRFGPDIKYLVSVSQNRSTARRDRIDIELGYLDGNPSGGSLEDMFVLAAESRNIGGLGSALYCHDDHSPFHPYRSQQQVILQ